MSTRKAFASFFLFMLTMAGGFLFSSANVLAQEQAELDAVAESAGFGSADLLSIIGTIINVFLGILGVVFLILFIYAGFVWMTAGGDEKKVEKGKRILINATVGLVIILGAYGITTFIMNILGDATGTGNTGTASNGSVSVERLSGSLGNGPIQDHFPGRNATDVPRNTRIMITFKNPMDAASVTENTIIYPSKVGADTPLAAEVQATEDGKTFVFKPSELLGSAAERVEYTVALDNDMADVDGDFIFTGSNNEGYEWSFETGTSIDLTAPEIVSVTPAGNGTYAKNIVTQVTFSEAVDPTTASGFRQETSGFDNITVAGTSGSPTPGEYRVSNAYRTVTFVPSTKCGTNSCNEDVFCLPAAQAISANVKAAAVGTEPPQATFPYKGIVDMAGNALDGNGDGTAGDAFSWSFTTTDAIELRGPILVSLAPDVKAEEVALDQDIELTFDSVLMSSSVSSDSVILSNKELSSGSSHEQWFTVREAQLRADGQEVAGVSERPTQTRVTMPHGTFLESVDGASYVYGVEATHALKNEYQNCYVPAKGPDAVGGTCAVSKNEPYCCNGTPSATACTLF